MPAEINLLDEYLLPNEGNKTAFRMEPGDVVYLPTTLILPPGDYLLKVSFYGNKSDKRFLESSDPRSGGIACRAEMALK